MKHYAINQEQFCEVSRDGYLRGTTPLPELKRLSDEEIKLVLVSVDPETKRLPPGFRDFAHALMDKIGVPK